MTGRSANDVMPLALHVGDVWKGSGHRGRNLMRTILDIWLVPEGERVEYFDEESWGVGQCWGPTFRQWVHYHRAEHSVDDDVVAAHNEEVVSNDG